MKTAKENVIAYVEANSYLQLDDEEEISFTTRRHGNVGDGSFCQTAVMCWAVYQH